MLSQRKIVEDMKEAARQTQISMLVDTISDVVDRWPRVVRVPRDLQRAIASAILDRIQN